MLKHALRNFAAAVVVLICATIASMAADISPPYLKDGFVMVRANPPRDIHGQPDITGEIHNRSQKSWIAIHFTCYTDNTRTDGLPSYTFRLSIRYRAPLRPGEQRRFSVSPDSTADRMRLHDALARYPQPYWWICGENPTGDDIGHQVFTLGIHPPPSPLMPMLRGRFN